MSQSLNTVSEHVNADEVLVSLVLTGNDEAYEKIVNQYRDKVIQLAYVYLKNYEDARDASQDIFVKTYEKLRQFRKQSKFSTWLYRVAVNHCLDLLRRNNMKFNNNECIFENIATTELSPSQKSSLLFRDDALKRAVQKLSTQQQIIIILRYFENNSIKEVAEILRLSSGTIKAATSQAIQNLKKIIITEGGGES
ncbi:MAG: RNA polymerase sigma-70 factor (ECF subfamily) [Candidatus Omnitrophota bacterium]|jgi:RNA polymerase sigma-70 factor (ECF subfamily)